MNRVQNHLPQNSPEPTTKHKTAARKLHRTNIPVKVSTEIVAQDARGTVYK